MTKRQWVIIGAVIFILITSYGIMKFLIAQKPEVPRRPPRAGERWVQAEPVTYTSVTSPVKAKGRVVSTSAVELVAEASGRIESGDVPLKAGQSFKKGQILLTIYKDEAELSLKSQKSRFLNSVANLLPDIRVDYPDEEDKFRAFFNAIQIEKPLPPLPEANNEKLKIFLASRNILADYYAVLQAELKLSRHSIAAPFDGVLSAVNLEVGAYTNTGGRIGRMIATRALEVEVPVEISNARWIRSGDDVVLQSSDRKVERRGKVSRISDYVDESTQSRSVYVNVPFTSKTSLFAGEYLFASFEGGQVENAMEIPRNAIFNANEVFLVIDGLLKIEETDVLKMNETTAIIRGLEPGVFIVTQPMINVSENTAVKILGVDQREEKQSPDQKMAPGKSSQ